MEIAIASSIWTVDRVLQPDTCRHLIAEAERRTWYPSNIDKLHNSGTTKNSRSITSIEIDAPLLFSPIQDLIPHQIEGMEVVGLAQEQFLCYRYRKGEQFTVHTDKPFQGENGLKSLFTFLVYLNDDFSGGQTLFPKIAKIKMILPKAGMAVIFPHDEPHGSLEVRHGNKYILRSVILYQVT